MRKSINNKPVFMIYLYIFLKNLTSDDFNEGIALNEISVEFIKDCVENPEGVEPCA